MPESSLARRAFSLSFLIVSLALASGMILTIVSWLKLCSVECSEGHKYRLFGFPFEVLGGIFFVGTGIVHFLSWRNPKLTFLTALLLVGGLGAELYFILMQKYQIGVWCPVCLGIAASIGIAALALAVEYGIHFRKILKLGDRGEIMKNIWKGASTCAIFCIGFALAFFGTSKFNPLQAAEKSLKDNLAFGNQDSQVDVYIFTDWVCPACRHIEPRLEGIVQAAGEKAKIYFIDLAVHPETMNFTPYNMSFMVHNKPAYFKLRKMLENISQETGTPSQEQIETEMRKLGQKFVELNYADVDVGNKYFKKLEKQFSVNKTPTLVVVNSEAKKGKKLSGGEITKENVLNSINLLSK
ncbi:putative uncharacterized protein [Parachlamydia acanthamoebae UV-7]|uniref:Thioredoxin-like fold domain-containing protein n=1 Tax=Parachlamydia acanthamoebae (strain UV7) TaxID=765952 RepID=F8L0L2_PARAV|nr:thioredoxin domain-containing protein [Parachlamydia acanthamoebae]CCB86762.1 putative uncharacterized protein [Parachlamydia acanthamoebae UV-7]